MDFLICFPWINSLESQSMHLPHRGSIDFLACPKGYVPGLLQLISSFLTWKKNILYEQFLNLIMVPKSVRQKGRAITNQTKLKKKPPRSVLCIENLLEHCN